MNKYVKIKISHWITLVFKNFKFLTVFTIFLYSCNSNVCNSDNHIAKKNPDVINVFDEKLFSMMEFSKNKTDAIFIVDASCSYCIGHFFDELQLLNAICQNNNVILGNIIVVLPEGNTMIMKYYLSRNTTFNQLTFKIIEIPESYNSLFAYYNGYFYFLRDKELYEMWQPKYE